MRLPDPIFQLEEFVMFLKKSLLFSMALALLMFAGQASAQVTLTHVTDGTAGTVAGNGTSFTVRISPGDLATNPAVAAVLASVTTVAAIEIQLEYASSLSLSVALPYRLDSTNTKVTLIGGPALTGVPLAVPAMIDLTFTTTADVTDVEFSISITGATVSVGSGADSMFPVPVTAMITFNEGGTGTPPGDGNGDGNGDTGGGDNGDTGMPMPGYDNLSVSLTRVGEGPVNAGDEVVVDVAVAGLEGATVGAVITIESDVATIKEDGVMAAGFRVLESDDTSATLFGLPTMLTDGSYGTLTLALSADYDGSMASISASVTVLTPGGMKVSAAAGAPLVVNGFAPFLEADTDVTDALIVPHGETVTVTVTAMDLRDEAVSFTVTTDGDAESSEDPESGTVTLSATGDGTATVMATAGGVDLDPVNVVFEKAPPELQTDMMTEVEIPRDGEATATVTAVGFDEGVEPVLSITGAAGLKKLDDGVSWAVTTSTPGDVMVTATQGDDTASITVTFVAEPPELEPSVTEATIPVGGSAVVVVTALGLGDGINYSYTETGTAEVGLVTDGATATVTASGRGSAEVSVTASDAAGRTTEAISITFSEGELTLSSVEPVMVPVGGSGSATVTASGQADDAVVAFRLEEGSEGATLADNEDGTATLTASGVATAIVTAWVGDVGSIAATVEFVDGALALEANVSEPVPVAPGGTGTATVNLVGLAEGDVHSFSVDAEGVEHSIEGATA